MLKCPVTLNSRHSSRVMHRVELPISYTLLVCALVCWIGGILVVAVCNFWVAYDKINTNQKHSNWVKERCQDEEFVQNIRVHSNLCDNVDAKNVDIFEDSLKKVIEGFRWCGFVSCCDLFYVVYNFVCTKVWSFVIPFLLAVVVILIGFRPYFIQCSISRKKLKLFSIQNRHTLPTSTKLLKIS
jgi:hypothetical protein